ncbi:Integrase [hydrothermal vent metagenome]|uniref:Integrase n=1 Tax=hydrothermal vent metagenome TaxID=652676 RepID=A0A3B0X837_9ZZZZ
MARPRSKGRKDLPDNLHPVLKSRVIYYSYRNPNTGERTGFGTNKPLAVKAAKRMNALLYSADEQVMQLVNMAQQPVELRQSAAQSITQADTLFTGYLEHFKTQTLPRRRNKKGLPLSPATLRDYTNQIEHLQASSLGAMSIGFMGSYTHSREARKLINQYLEQFPDTSSNRRRGLLIQILKQAIGDGECDRNNADDTIKKTEEVKRQRLPLETFQQIYQEAAPWYKNLLDLALQTLQRREDLVVMEFSQIENNQLRFVQIKTGQAIAINIGDELGAVIKRCHDQLASPYLIHYRPMNTRRAKISAKNHWTSVSVDKATKEFSRLRDELGLFKHLPPRERPSFHEIRSLGAELYRKAGWAEEAIQQLLGHTNAKMTQVYLDRHQKDTVEYNVVASGLVLPCS